MSGPAASVSFDDNINPRFEFLLLSSGLSLLPFSLNLFEMVITNKSGNVISGTPPDKHPYKCLFLYRIWAVGFTRWIV